MAEIVDRGVQCNTVEQVIKYVLKRNSATSKTIVQNLCTTLHDAGYQYHGLTIAQGLKNDNQHGTGIIDMIVNNDTKIHAIIKALYPNSIINKLFDLQFKDQVIQKCNLDLEEGESLLGLYIRSSQKPEIRNLIDFALQYPETIKDYGFVNIISNKNTIIVKSKLYSDQNKNIYKEYIVFTLNNDGVFTESSTTQWDHIDIGHEQKVDQYLLGDMDNYEAATFRINNQIDKSTKDAQDKTNKSVNNSLKDLRKKELELHFPTLLQPYINNIKQDIKRGKRDPRVINRLNAEGIEKRSIEEYISFLSFIQYAYGEDGIDRNTYKSKPERDRFTERYEIITGMILNSSPKRNFLLKI